MKETRSYTPREVLESDRLKTELGPVVDRPREFWPDMEARILALGYDSEYAKSEVNVSRELAEIGPVLGVSEEYVKQALLEAVEGLEMFKAMGF